VTLVIRAFLSLASIESLNSFLPGLYYNVPSNYRQSESVPVLVLRPAKIGTGPTTPTRISRIDHWQPDCVDEEITHKRLEYVLSRQGITCTGTGLAALRKYAGDLPEGSFANSSIRYAIEIRERPHVDIVRRAFNIGAQAIRELTYLPSTQLEALISIYLEGRE
jgi:hypothetical protein